MRSWSPVCILGGTREYLGCRRSRSERNPAGPRCFDAPLANCTWAVGSCALRTVPPSVVGCDLYSQWKTVCSAKEDFGLNITSKEMRLALFPPPVASLQTGKLLSFCACCLTPSSLLFSTGFCTFLLVCFVVGYKLTRRCQHHRCRYRDVEPQSSVRTTAACKTAKRGAKLPVFTADAIKWLCAASTWC